MMESMESKRERQRHRYKTNPQRRFSKYRDNARRKQIPFHLDIDVATRYFKSACYYCGIEPILFLNGIDRVDSNGPYIRDNCVPCCSLCNMMKGDMDCSMFLQQCHSVSDFQNKNKYG